MLWRFLRRLIIKVACLLNLLGIALKLECLHNRVKTVTEKIRQTHKKRYRVILLLIEEGVNKVVETQCDKSSTHRENPMS